VVEPEPVVVEPEPVAEPEPIVVEAVAAPAPVAAPQPTREPARRPPPASIPPRRRRRRLRSVVLLAATAGIATVAVLSFMDETSVPDGLLPSWPVADDGASTATPVKPKVVPPKKKGATTPTVPKKPTSAKPSRTAKPKPTPKSKGTGTQTSKPRQTAPTKPKPKPKPRASKPAGTTPVAPEPRRFAWAPVAGAVSYHVELFRGNDRVLVTDTKEPVLELGPTWRHEGRLMRLEKGSYRWYVWSVSESGRDPRAIVQATLSVP
jgi:hypothetical protein